MQQVTRRLRYLSLEDAQKLGSIKADVLIKLDKSLLGNMKELSAILAHELHATFADKNAALAYLWSLLGSNAGHDKNNPNGKTADEEEEEARKNIKKLKGR